MRMKLACFATTTAATLAAQAGGPVGWADPIDGDWNLAANWNPAVIPGATNGVTLGHASPYTVNLGSSNQSAGSLTLMNPNAVLRVTPGRTLSLFGSVGNAGQIAVNPDNNGSITSLTFENDAIIMGIGEILLGGPGSRAQITGASGVTITHTQGHTIRGAGRVTAPMINHGEIIADSPLGDLLLSSGNKSNSGTLRAIGDGTLALSGFTLDQTADALVLSDGPDSSVTISGMTINLGTLRSVNSGLVEFISSSSTIDSVTLEGDVTIAAGRTITATDTLTNHAMLDINPTNSNSITTLRTTSDDLLIHGDGEIILGGPGSLAQITASGGWRVTHAQGHTIRGTGRITAPLINHGEIIADSTVGPLTLSGGDKSTTTDIRAVNGATLELSGFTLDLAPGLAVSADGPGGGMTLSGMTINNGSLRVTNGALIEFISSSSTIDSVTLEGDVTVAAGRTITANNTLTNHATLDINPTNSNSITTLRTTSGDLLIQGEGEIILGGPGSLAQITASGGWRVTHAQGHTIRGTGRISAPLINHGEIIADSSAGPLTFSGSDKSTTTDIRAVNGASIELSGFTLDLAPDLAVSAEGPGGITLTGMTVNNGTLRVTDGGLIDFFSSSSTIDSVTLEGEVLIPAGRTINANNTLTNHATIDINPTNNNSITTLRTINGDLLIQGDGEIMLGATGSLAQISASGGWRVTHAQDHTIRGAGRIAAPMTNHGAIEPGTPDDPVATMEATRPITNTPSASLSIKVAGDQQSGRIESTSDYHADGTLDIEFIDGFDPPLGWVATIVTTGTDGVSGAFHTVNAPQPTDPRLEFRVVYDADEIRVGAFCLADINSDGLLNFFDISAFIALFNAQDPAADIAPPFGVWNFFDIAEYLARYNEGCP
ncbi:MAG: hypothetical protein LAT64_13695 [Phycisphaerales bacterium]|nr:hypothetical protein [Planctomycetota bacterium]MCH8509805.1 hypothetical protein [Phycisphaerales bacterium]